MVIYFLSLVFESSFFRVTLKSHVACFCVVIAPMIVDIPTVLDFVAKTWKKPISVVAMVDDVKTSNVFKFGFDNGCFFDINSGVKQWLQVKFERLGFFVTIMSLNINDVSFCCRGDLRLGVMEFFPISPPPWSVVKKGGAFRPLMASPALPAEPMDVTGLVRRPRRSLMVTHRATAKPRETQRLVWHPKQPAAGGKRPCWIFFFEETTRGPSPCGPLVKLCGPAEEKLEGGPNILNQVNSHSSGPVQRLGPILMSGGPVLEESNFNNYSNVGHVDPISSKPTQTIIGPVHLDHAIGGQVGLTSSKPVGECVDHVQINEEQALSHFFKAQEELMNDLKHFGKLDLYEIRKIGGDIGVPASSEVNERTIPFKKRKFESSASLSSRPHKIHRKYPGVVRDFPWDSKQKENDPDMVLDEPSEDSSNSPSRSGILKNPLIGSFVIDDAVSSGSAYSHTPVEENVESPP
uniref:Uncharacterized protein n=1 Tax=Cannabis sativa TaxID=3483 RepID=A0A803PKL3_CANSA